MNKTNFTIISLSLTSLVINGMIFLCLVDNKFHRSVRYSWKVFNIYGEFWNKPLHRYLAMQGIEIMLDIEDGKKINLHDYAPKKIESENKIIEG